MSLSCSADKAGVRFPVSESLFCFRDASFCTFSPSFCTPRRRDTRLRTKAGSLPIYPSFSDLQNDRHVSLRVLLVLLTDSFLSVLHTVFRARATLTPLAVLYIPPISKLLTTVYFPPLGLNQENVRASHVPQNPSMASPYVPPEDFTEVQHNGTEHLAINNTFRRRFTTRLALHTTAKFYARNGLCVPISKHKIVKTGHWVHLTEGATMKYLSERTALPVPKVYCSFLHKNRAYVVMERIQGEALPRVWKSLSKESLEGVLSQLKEMLQELRSFTPPPGTGVENCVEGSLYDSRLTHRNPRFGPFKETQDFHRWLRKDLKPEDLKDREKD